jgi:hypothetical protein
MDLQEFIRKRPYLYHLTERRNLDLIVSAGSLYSTVELIGMSDAADKSDFLTTRRASHATVSINGRIVYIRDQQPLTKALDRCLTDGWKREQFIRFLNDRVFFWPTEKRLGLHFERYQDESPVILRLPTAAVIQQNKNPLFTHLNSGATRCIPKYRGAPPRGKDTFRSAKRYDKTVGSVAEVTFLKNCFLPEDVEIANSPDGRWKKIKP